MHDVTLFHSKWSPNLRETERGRAAAGRPWGTSATLSRGAGRGGLWKERGGPGSAPAVEDDICIQQSGLCRKFEANTSPLIRSRI